MVLIFVFLLAIYTFCVVKIKNLGEIISLSSELAVILFACAFALCMILIIKILWDRMNELEDENYKLNRQIVSYKCRYYRNDEDKLE